MRFIPFTVAACTVGLFTSSLCAQPSDTSFVEWKSTVGTSVVAKLVGENAKDKTITLEKKDGKRITVPLAKLSDDSQKLAQTVIREHRRAKNLIGTWYWRCPAKNEPKWRIKSTLTRTGRYYRLVEISTGHSKATDSETSYLYRKKGRVFLPVDNRNAGEKRSPFTIDSKGDRISYYRQVVVGDREIVPGGNFLEINYAKNDDAETWKRQNETFPPIKPETPIRVGT